MSSYQLVDAKEAKAFLGSFILFEKRSIRFVVASIRRNLLFVAAITLIGAAISFYYWNKKPTYYQSEMVCSFNNLHKKTFGEMVKRLDVLAATQSYKQLSTLLGISVADAKKIKGFEAKNVAGSPLYEDLSTDKAPMYFTLKASNINVFQPVQEGLINYLNSSPYQAIRTELDREKIEQKVAYLNASVHKIDTVIDAYAAFLYTSGAVADSAAGFSNINELFKRQEELVNKKLDEKKLSHLLQSVEIIYGFAPAEQLSGKNKSDLLKLIIACLALAVFIAVLKELLSYE